MGARYRHGVRSRAGVVPLYDPDVRSLVLALCLVAGCKKHTVEEAPPPVPAEPSRGHSVTHFKDAGHADEAAEAKAGSDDGGVDDGGTADAATFGGNGSPAYRDEHGHVHGPGGPVYMGRSQPCDASRDHCMRDGVWFAADNYDSKHLFRAVPAFKFEDTWYNWRGAEVDSGKLFKTELATVDKLRAGSPAIVWLPENDSATWPENEYQALTSSRWDVAVIQSVNRSAKTFRIPTWPQDLPIDTARVITQQASH
jgi:hypothetical protein